MSQPRTAPPSSSPAAAEPAANALRGTNARTGTPRRRRGRRDALQGGHRPRTGSGPRRADPGGAGARAPRLTRGLHGTPGRQRARPGTRPRRPPPTDRHGSPSRPLERRHPRCVDRSAPPQRTASGPCRTRTKARDDAGHRRRGAHRAAACRAPVFSVGPQTRRTAAGTARTTRPCPRSRSPARPGGRRGCRELASSRRSLRTA